MMQQHIFEVFEHDDKRKAGVWCKHCNTTLYEVTGMHFLCPVCEGPTECGNPSCTEGCDECRSAGRG